MLAQILGIALVTAFTGLLLVLRQSIGSRRTGRWPRKAYLLELKSWNSDDNQKSLEDWPESIEIHAEIEQAGGVGVSRHKNSKGSSALLLLGLAFGGVFSFLTPARAQSTIFNIPTTDVVAGKKTYFEFDFIAHLESNANGGFQDYVPRIVFGLGHKLEVGVNVAAVSSIAPTTVYVQPNIKWQFYSNEKAGTAFSAGAIAFAAVKDRSSNDSFGLIYLNGSKKFSGDHGPRVTFGPYGLVSYDAAAGPNRQKPTLVGVMAGYEQPLSKKVSFVADWYSGNNGLGYATPGISIALPKNGVFNVGYSVGNTGRKNNGLFLYYGITL